MKKLNDYDVVMETPEGNTLSKCYTTESLRKAQNKAKREFPMNQVLAVIPIVIE